MKEVVGPGDITTKCFATMRRPSKSTLSITQGSPAPPRSSPERWGWGRPRAACRGLRRAGAGGPFQHPHSLHTPHSGPQQPRGNVVLTAGGLCPLGAHHGVQKNKATVIQGGAQSRGQCGRQRRALRPEWASSSLIGHGLQEGVSRQPKRWEKGAGRAQADAWRQKKTGKCRLFCSSLCFSSTAASSGVCPGILTCYCLKELGIIL